MAHWSVKIENDIAIYLSRLKQFYVSSRAEQSSTEHYHYHNYHLVAVVQWK